MKRRRYAREIALKILYQSDISGSVIEDELPKQINKDRLNDDTTSFLLDLINGIQKNQNEIDNLITKTAHKWKLNRITIIDRNILRLAIYEILYHKETPRNVIINEAIEIAKKFGGPKSYQFINGILDNIAKTIQNTKSKIQIET